jgi:hypothetical protein
VRESETELPEEGEKGGREQQEGDERAPERGELEGLERERTLRASCATSSSTSEA